MSKNIKILWGAATLAPFGLILAGIVSIFTMVISNLPEKGSTMPPEFVPHFLAGLFCVYGFVIVGILLSYLINISYFIHMVRKEDLGKDQRTLWAVLFLVVHIFAMIVYWFIHVWPEDSPKKKRS